MSALAIRCRKRHNDRNLRKNNFICATSVNTLEIGLEAQQNSKQKELIQETEDFIDQLEIVDFDYDAFQAGRIMATLRKRGNIIELGDLFGAAFAVLMI